MSDRNEVNPCTSSLMSDICYQPLVRYMRLALWRWERDNSTFSIFLLCEVITRRTTLCLLHACLTIITSLHAPSPFRIHQQFEASCIRSVSQRMNASVPKMPGLLLFLLKALFPGVVYFFSFFDTHETVMRASSCEHEAKPSFRCEQTRRKRRRAVWIPLVALPIDFW